MTTYFNEKEPGLLPAWHRWYPYDVKPPEAFLRQCFLVALPVPWRVNGKWVRRTVRATLSNVRKEDDTVHNHPGSAIRFIIWNGYREEVTRPDGSTFERDWLPGLIGYIPSTMYHRIVKVYGGDSYSVWFRGVVSEDIHFLKSTMLRKDTTIRVASHPRRARTY